MYQQPNESVRKFARRVRDAWSAINDAHEAADGENEQTWIKRVNNVLQNTFMIGAVPKISRQLGKKRDNRISRKSN